MCCYGDSLLILRHHHHCDTDIPHHAGTRVLALAEPRVHVFDSTILCLILDNHLHALAGGV
jgi:hypothetical protein